MKSQNQVRELITPAVAFIGLLLTIAIGDSLFPQRLPAQIASPLTIVWVNEASKAYRERQYAEYVKQHPAMPKTMGKAPSQILFAIDENSAYELGFRSDGVVVWRKSDRKK